MQTIKFLLVSLLLFGLLSSCQSKKPFYPEIVPQKAETEKEHLEKIFSQSRRLIQSLGLNHQPKLSFLELRGMIKKKVKQNQGYQASLGSALEWVDYVEKKSNRFKNLYQFPYLWQASLEPLGMTYVRLNQYLVTPFQKDMFAHCRASFYQKTKRIIKVNSGYRSPAYQLYLTSFMAGSLEEVFKKAAPPFYSRHQKEEPDLSIGLVKKERNPEVEAELLSQINEACAAFGISQSFRGLISLRFEFSTQSQASYYQPIWESTALSEELKADFKIAMEKSKFYPSRQGLKVIFAMAWKESSWRMDPRLIKPKKLALRQKFQKSLQKLESGMTGKVANYFLDQRFFTKKDQLQKELLRITEPNNFHLTEWDVYLWTQEAHQLLQDLEKEYSTLARFGSLVFDYKPLLNRFAHEPQSFGLWQVNVNYLAEKLESEAYWRKKYPEVFRGRKINREELIMALSGKEKGRMEQVKSLALVLEAYLAPRYFNHNLGGEGDLYFFAGENLSGSLSSYKAALQIQLRTAMGSQIIADGDLAQYAPYSQKPDFTKSSNSLKLLRRFVRVKGIGSAKGRAMVRELVKADSKRQLFASPLYRMIMKGKIGRRVMPEVKSRIIGQSPNSYGYRVLKLAGEY